MTTITVLDSTGATQTVAKVLNTGTAADAASLPVARSTEDKAVAAAANVSLASLDTKLPATLGIKTAAGSVSVAPASDGLFNGKSYLTSPTQGLFGFYAKVDPFGGLQTTGSLAPLLTDAFDAALDTTNRWAASGTVVPVVSGSAVVGSLGAVNSASSVLVSQPNFNPAGQSHLLAGQLSIGAAQTNPNAHRFFGQGVVTSYASATPLTNGFGFEVDLTGALNAVVYIAGVRYVANSTNPALITAPGSWAVDMIMAQFSAMTWPVSGTAIVLLRYFAGYCYFYVADAATGTDIPIALASWVPAQTLLPVRFAAITTPAVSTVLATTWALSGFLLGAAGGTNYTNSDPVYPWRQQNVDAQGRAYGITPELTTAGTITTQNLVPAGVATANSAVTLTTNGFPALMIQTTGTYTGALSLQATVDGTTWVTLGGIPLINLATGGNLASITSALQSIFQADVGGALQVRVTALAAVTGTATVSLRVLPSAPSMVTLDAALPTGANTIGAVTVSSGTVTTLTTLTTLANGQTAHSATATGSPVRIGGKILTTVDTTVATGEATDAIFDLSGAQTIKPFAASTLDWQAAAGAGGIVNTSDVVLKAAGAASVRNYVTAVQIQNASATVATEVVIKDGSTVIWRGYVSSGVNAPSLNVEFPTPLRGTAATAMNVACITTAAAVYVNAQGYQAM